MLWISKFTLSFSTIDYKVKRWASPSDPTGKIKPRGNEQLFDFLIQSDSLSVSVCKADGVNEANYNLLLKNNGSELIWMLWGNLILEDTNYHPTRLLNHEPFGRSVFKYIIKSNTMKAICLPAESS